MTLDRKTAARILRRIATLMELHGDNPHRIRSFANASRTIERLEGDLGEMVASGRILEVRGIGKGTAAVLAEIAAGSTPPVLAELEARTPPGLLELFELPGLGPKRIRTLWRELGITSLGELEYACLENRLIDLPGFGPRMQDRIIEAIAFRRRSQARRRIDEAWASAVPLLAALGAAGRRANVAGGLRRGCETVDAVEIVVSCDDPGVVLTALAPHVTGARADGGSVAGTTTDGLPVRVHTADPRAFGATLLYRTGNGEHLEALERRAADGGLELGPDGLFSGSDRIAGADEEGVYEALELPWIPPELRDDPGTVERASAGTLPRLVTVEDLHGALHNHTRDSDGAATLEEMADAARGLGWAFLGIADHSPAAHYANGLDADRLRAQWAAIDRWNAEHPDLRLIRGLEADILPDGALDIPPGCEEGLEYVVASVHSSFRMSRDAMTARLLAAVEHPSTTILGHPTGRLLLARPPYEADLEAVLTACAERGVAVEINANPHRLDLDWRWTRRALELGIPLAIDPDAHATDGLEDVRWGVTVARKAGARPEDVLGAGRPPLPSR